MKKINKGFTLIELLIAIAVFSVGIMAAFSLSMHNLNTVKENYNRVVAADLAREGIEVVRNIRDSNWLAREANIDDPSTSLIFAWDAGLDHDCFGVDYRSNTLNNIVTADLDVAINQAPARLYLNSGLYDYSGIGQDTGFKRAICLKAICLNTAPAAVPPIETISNNLACPGLEKIGLQVTARVQYTYGNRVNKIDAVENIYNWRQ